MSSVVSRRDFLRAATLASAAILLPGRSFASEPEFPKMVSLGKTLKFPLLGIGTGVKAGNRSNGLWRSGEEVKYS